MNASGLTSRRNRLRLDAGIVLAIFVSGALIGSRYMGSYQEPTPEDLELGAAVAFACGRGYVLPAAPIPALGAFLQRRTGAFSCDQLPAVLTPAPLGLMQEIYRYLMMAVAIQWQWSGVSWRALAPLFGVMFAVTLCAVYGLLRLGVGPWPAVLGVVPLVISTHHLRHLPQLRDYAKAPFILLLILVAAHLAMPPLRARRSLVLAAIYGVILGLGLGFRNDLLINLPPFLVAVALLTPGAWTANLRLKAACVALALGTFVVSAWPILAAYRSGSNTGHVAVLGLTSAFDVPLGVTRPVYDLGSRYLDGYVATVINVHSRLRSGRFAGFASADYDAASLALLADVARHWPADIAARGLASVTGLLGFGFTIDPSVPVVPPGVSGSWLLTIYEWRQTTLRLLAGLGPLLAGAAVIIVGSRDVRAGIALVLFVLYYCGYPAIQFQVRHFFHLEFITWWAMVFVVAAAGRVFLRWVKSGGWPRVSLVELRNASIAGGVAVALIAGPLLVLRIYQHRHLVTLFDGYLQAPRTTLALNRTMRAGRAFVAVEGLWDGLDPADPYGVRYLAAEFASADRCAAVDLPVTVTYEATTAANDFSFVRRLAIAADGPTYDLLPAYSSGTWSRFAGFSLPEGYEGCLKSVSVIDDPSRLPVLVELTLTPRWRSTGLFQRLAAVENDPDHALVQAVPGDLALAVDRSVSPDVALVADSVAQGVTADEARRSWSSSAPIRIATPHQLLVHFAAIPAEAGMVLTAQGVLRRGGLRIGTAQNEHLVDSRAIVMPGPFAVFIGVPSPGAYAVRVTDEGVNAWRQEASLLWSAIRLLAPWSLVADFELHGVGWIKSVTAPVVAAR